jgi:hypothetical protein
MNAERVRFAGRPTVGFALGDPELSYEDAVNAVASTSELEQTDPYGHAPGVDLTDSQLSAPMGSIGNSIAACGVPNGTSVTVKVAVKYGRAVGVTVETDPSDPTTASCVARAVRKLRWPSSPKLDTLTTRY